MNPTTYLPLVGGKDLAGMKVPKCKSKVKWHSHYLILERGREKDREREREREREKTRVITLFILRHENWVMDN